MPPAFWMCLPRPPCADIEMSSSIRSRFDLPVPLGPMITFKSVGAQEMFLRDLKPLISRFNIFIEKPPNERNSNIKIMHNFYVKFTFVWTDVTFQFTVLWPSSIKQSFFLFLLGVPDNTLS